MGLSLKLRAQIDEAGEASCDPLTPFLCAGDPGPRDTTQRPPSVTSWDPMAQAPHFTKGQTHAHALPVQCTQLHHKRSAESLRRACYRTWNHLPGHSHPPGLSTGTQTSVHGCPAGPSPTPLPLHPCTCLQTGGGGVAGRGVHGFLAPISPPMCCTHCWACCHLSLSDLVSGSHTVGGSSCLQKGSFGVCRALRSFLPGKILFPEAGAMTLPFPWGS